MRVYLAAPWAHKEAARQAAEVIAAAGHEITEAWWEHPEVEAYGKEEIPEDDLAELDAQAVKDINGVLKADAFVLLNTEKSEGKAVETGIAIMCVLPIILVGKRTNLFHYLPEVTLVDSVEEACAALEGVEVLPDVLD